MSLKPQLIVILYTLNLHLDLQVKMYFRDQTQMEAMSLIAISPLAIWVIAAKLSRILICISILPVGTTPLIIPTKKQAETRRVASNSLWVASQKVRLIPVWTTYHLIRYSTRYRCSIRSNRHPRGDRSRSSFYCRQSRYVLVLSVPRAWYITSCESFN